METNNTVTYCGSVTKKEALIPLETNILEDTWVAEANFPYANYYGQVPTKPKPNSIFLFTENFYSLEEVLWFSNELSICTAEKINVASAFIEYQKKQFPAIRVKNFPDYEQIKNLQNCLNSQGVLFSKRVPFVSEIKVVINKCFVLEKLKENIFLDKVEENKGYFTTSVKIDRKNFDSLYEKVRNNSDCPIFDAVPGGFIMDSASVDFIRIYSEHTDLELLKCIQQEFSRMGIK